MIEEYCYDGRYSTTLNGIPVCRVCEKGTYIPDYRHERTSCIECPNGTYQDEHGKNKCKKCPVGTSHELTRQTSKNSCVDCSDGTYNIVEGGMCKDCPKGKQSNSNYTECISSSQIKSSNFIKSRTGIVTISISGIVVLVGVIFLIKFLISRKRYIKVK